MGQELDYMDVDDLPVHVPPDEGRIRSSISWGQEIFDGPWVSLSILELKRITDDCNRRCEKNTESDSNMTSHEWS